MFPVLILKTERMHIIVIVTIVLVYLILAKIRRYYRASLFLGTKCGLANNRIIIFINSIHNRIITVEALMICKSWVLFTKDFSNVPRTKYTFPAARSKPIINLHYN